MENGWWVHKYLKKQCAKRSKGVMVTFTWLKCTKLKTNFINQAHTWICTCAWWSKTRSFFKLIFIFAASIVKISDINTRWNSFFQDFLSPLCSNPACNWTLAPLTICPLAFYIFSFACSKWKRIIITFNFLTFIWAGEETRHLLVIIVGFPPFCFCATTTHLIRSF